MRFLRSIRSPFRTAVVSRQRRRGTRTSLACESLEFRQLLSAGGSGNLVDQITAQPAVQIVPFAGGGPSGYSPAQIRTAYGVNQIKFLNGTITGNGAGQTIAIVDAYNDPNIAADLAKFDAAYGLPAPPSFKVDNLGATTTDPGWALETSLDVEWAHALAPAANIILVEAPSATLGGLFNAVSAASHLSSVSVVSMSWGTPEFFGEWNYDSTFTTPAGHIPITYLASSGDSGAWYGPMYPSVSPNVVAVGGTTLTLGTGNSYGSESGWSGSTGGFSGTDNGFYFGEYAPSYQVAAQQAAGLSYGVRTTPDVSFNADPNTGVAVYDSVPYSGQAGWFDVGGTSVAAPSWAGLVAVTDQGLAAASKSTLSSTQLLTQLYNLPSSDFHQITSGYNGYYATAGYNLVTGLGTPNANLLVAGLLSANGVSSAKSGASSAVAASAAAHAHSGSSGGHRFDSVSSTSSSSNSGNAGSTSTIASAPANTTVTITALYAPLPATAAATAQTGGSNGQGQGIAGVGSTSTASAVGSSLGQGLQSPNSLVVVVGNTSQDGSGASIIDTVDSAEAPAQPANPAAEPAAEPQSEPAQQPILPPELRNPLFDATLPGIDALINRWEDSELAPPIETLPAGPASINSENESQPRAASGIAVLLGTAVVVASSHGLATYRSGWRQRWLSHCLESTQ
jgi:subtilase family serine protease